MYHKLCYFIFIKGTAFYIRKNGTLEPFGWSPKYQHYIAIHNCYEAYQRQQRIVAESAYFWITFSIWDISITDRNADEPNVFLVWLHRLDYNFFVSVTWPTTWHYQEKLWASSWMDFQGAIMIFKKIFPFQSKYFAYCYTDYVSISVFHINAVSISLSSPPCLFFANKYWCDFLYGL